MADGRKKSTNITGRARPELKEAFAAVAAELGMNESQLVIALATWVVLHRRLPEKESARKPQPHQQQPTLPPVERLEFMAETLLRKELSAALVVLLAAGGMPTAKALEAVRCFYLDGPIREEV
jgi:antitoxin component of RelBE/YafQ-DinJ toxin-antitoxin module